MGFLFEKAGVIEFDNQAYRKNIAKISNELNSYNGEYDETLNYPMFKGINFKKFAYFDFGLSWLHTLNIYITSSDKFDAGALTDDIAIKNGLFVKNNDDIVLATIYIFNDYSEDLIPVLFHEITHIYDHSKCKEIWYEDEQYFLEHQTYDINKYGLKTDVNGLTLEDIHNIITESMYYSNFSESHAFMENINFDIYKNLNSHNRYFYSNDLDYIFYKSSVYIYGYVILDKLINDLKHINDSVKTAYYEKYKDELKTAYHSFNSLDKILNYLYKKLHKVVLHSRTLFNYYFNLDSMAFKQYSLNEDVKKSLIRSYFTTNRKFDI